MASQTVRLLLSGNINSPRHLNPIIYYIGSNFWLAYFLSLGPFCLLFEFQTEYLTAGIFGWPTPGSCWENYRKAESIYIQSSAIVTSPKPQRKRWRHHSAAKFTCSFHNDLRHCPGQHNAKHYTANNKWFEYVVISANCSISLIDRSII